MDNELYVILGATGQLGSRVARHLDTHGARLILVGRRREALHAVAGDLRTPAHALVFDVTDHDSAPLLHRIGEIGARRLVIIDTVLDKRSARTMRDSLAGSVALVTRTCRFADATGRHVRLVAASSVAARAHWAYSTSYARAKRRQAAYYRQLGTPGVLAYLPVLAGQRPPKPTLIDRALWPYFDFPVSVCSFDVAARLLALVTSNPHHDRHVTELQVLTPDRSLLTLRGLHSRRATKPIAAVAAVPVILLGRTFLRASPIWQRRAAYAARYLTPSCLREGWDHHRPILPPDAPRGRPDLEDGDIKVYFGSRVADVRMAE